MEVAFSLEPAPSLVPVREAPLLVLVGLTGVGKSTLLHVLGGLDAAEKGTVRIGETDLTSLSDAEVVAAIAGAVTGKRAGHAFERTGNGAPQKHMIGIGG